MNLNVKFFIKIFTLFFIIAYFAFFGLRNNTEAYYFGGKIISTIDCTCSGGQALTINGPRGSSGTYLYMPGSTRLYAKNVVKIFGVLLGKYTPGGQCLANPPTCGPAAVIDKGTINFTGTSS